MYRKASDNRSTATAIAALLPLIALANVPSDEKVLIDQNDARDISQILRDAKVESVENEFGDEYIEEVELKSAKTELEVQGGEIATAPFQR